MEDTPANELNRLLAVNMLYSAIVAALTVVVPLYLINQKIDLATIGLILSIGPLSFMLTRIFFASTADQIGTKVITVLHSLSNLAAIILYLVSSTVLGFSLATFAESIRTSAFWAVARTEILAETTHDNGTSSHTLAFFSGMRQLADAIGRLAIGFVLAYFAFQNAFLCILVLSIALLVLTLISKDHKPKIANHASNLAEMEGGVLKRIFRKRPITFVHASILLALIALPSNILFGYLIPVYSHSFLGLGYSEIGILIAIFSLVVAVSTIIATRLDLSRGVLLSATLLSVPMFIIWPHVGASMFITLILVAISIGFSNVLSEYILLDQIYRSKEVSTDIGTLYVLLKVIEFLYLASSGFIIAAYGYAPLFYLLAACMLLFTILSKLLFSNKRAAKPIAIQANNK